MRLRLPTFRASVSSLSLLAVSVSPACGGNDPGSNDNRVAERSLPVINGVDDREEPTVLAPPARDVVEQSVAALMWMQRIDYEEPGALRAVSLAEAAGVCEDERFAEQPTAAFCSGTLIDSDLLLTAGHCLGEGAEEAAERCRRLLVVFDYHLVESGELAPASADSVYSCRSVAFHEKKAVGEGIVDVGVIQLDRAVAAPHAPARIAEGELELGASLLAVSHGAGLPLKVDRGALVLELPEGAEYFVASTDSFGGGSGGPLFDASLGVVGYQLRGLADWKQDGDCLRAAYAAKPREQHQRIGPALRRLCDGGWPSERLCGVVPACGDGVCDASESADGCSKDCPVTRCGDGLCEVSERGECAADCSPFDHVPPDWLEDPASFEGDQPARRRTSKAGCALSGPVPAGSPTGWLGSLLLLLGLSALRRRA